MPELRKVNEGGRVCDPAIRIKIISKIHLRKVLRNRRIAGTAWAATNSLKITHFSLENTRNILFHKITELSHHYLPISMLESNQQI